MNRGARGGFGRRNGGDQDGTEKQSEAGLEAGGTGFEAPAAGLGGRNVRSGTTERRARRR